MRAGRVTSLHETGFLDINGIKIFGYEIMIEKESEKKKFKILRKNNIVALVISIQKTQVALWMTEQLL